MNNKDIIDKLNLIHTQKFSLSEFEKALQLIKESHVKGNKQKEAKQIWIYQTIIEIHQLYINAFKLLKDKKY